MAELVTQLHSMVGDVGMVVMASVAIAIISIAAGEAMLVFKRIVGVRRGEDPDKYR